MKRSAHYLLLLLATIPLPSLATSAETENIQLRQQIQQLQEQLRAAKAQCPVATAAPENTAVVAQPILQPAPSEPSAPPPGYKLVKVDPHEEPPLPKDDRWRDADNWDALHRGMSFAEVEQLLGTEHRVRGTKDRVQWTYGKVGPNPASRLLFVDNQLAVWERPNF